VRPVLTTLTVILLTATSGCAGQGDAARSGSAGPTATTPQTPTPSSGLSSGLSQGPSTPKPSSPRPSPVYAGCTDLGRVVARADLDADGSPEEVRLVRSGPEGCSGVLVATVGGVAVGTDVGGLDLVGAGAAVVRLTGPEAPDLVLLSSRGLDRGGAQRHLFGAGGPSGLREVTADGHPVLPFVATDGGAAPTTALCTPDGGIAVDTALTAEPPGIVLAWDVTRTSYDVRDGLAVNPRTRTIATDAADPVLREDRPELFRDRPFGGCR
jgi:hypothetical protein